MYLNQHDQSTGKFFETFISLLLYQILQSPLKHILVHVSFITTCTELTKAMNAC